jgi:cytidylate kinase
MKQVVAIDGPSGAGKSTVARMLAAKLGYTHLDTGAMYRAVALAASRRGISYGDGPGLDKLCAGLSIELAAAGDTVKVFLNGEDVTDAIRTPEMSLGSSAVSAVPQVRDHMVRLQRKAGEGGGVVAEGRDMGTVVFADTRAKFYLDASLEERARRRCDELEEKGMPEPLEKVLSQMEERDRNDSTRDHSPLMRADDAVYVDSTAMSPGEVVKTIARRVRELEAGL